MLFAQTLVANAGNDTTLCPGTSKILGGVPTASGGQAPYTYFWTPNINISSTTAANPVVNPPFPVWYVLTVTDDTGAVAKDTVVINLDPIYLYNAGPDTALCTGPTVTLGAPDNSFNGGVTYAWAPTSFLDDPTAPRPITSTTSTITYSLLITSPNCPSKLSQVTITIYQLPLVDACCYSTILEGQSVILNGSGAQVYNWFGGAGISNPSYNPVTVEPVVTTTYILYGEDGNGCVNYDSVTVVVIPDNGLNFYNTFSPNGDNVNDVFYIGNIHKFPLCRLEVYTRTGQLVYAKTGYDNSWDGTNYGDRLPEATYYYVLDPGDGSPKIYRSVTIVR
ncbi:MAG TPA: gliding motility-associated C-terminal domain-containing protein [Bacteroidia bacterium]|nr:gliding motility-associated C-terminal domain-containing protein [Bacteroidia bacterium]